MYYKTGNWSFDCSIKRWPKELAPAPVEPAPEAVSGFIADNKDLFVLLDVGALGLWIYGYYAKNKKLKNIGMAASLAMIFLTIRSD
jgi:hypothetical protein